LSAFSNSIETLYVRCAISGTVADANQGRGRQAGSRKTSSFTLPRPDGSAQQLAIHNVGGVVIARHGGDHGDQDGLAHRTQIFALPGAALQRRMDPALTPDPMEFYAINVTNSCA
jgi:hypothetical protein